MTFPFKGFTWAKKAWKQANEPISIDWTPVKRIAPFIPIVLTAPGVYASGVMVGVVQHKPAICYSFSAWYFGVMGALWCGWLLFDRMYPKAK